MWPFRASGEVAQLREDLESLKRAFKLLQLEWDDTLDKVRRRMGRLVKSAAVLEQHDQEITAADDGGGAESATPHRFLTPSQRIVQQSIMRRRAGG